MNIPLMQENVLDYVTSWALWIFTLHTMIILKSVLIPFRISNWNDPVQNKMQSQAVSNSGNTTNVYSGDAWLKSLPDHNLSWLRFFVIFLARCRQLMKRDIDKSSNASFQILQTHHSLVALPWGVKPPACWEPTDIGRRDVTWYRPHRFALHSISAQYTS
jgi:hypothetical protein